MNVHTPTRERARRTWRFLRPWGEEIVDGLPALLFPVCCVWAVSLYGFIRPTSNPYLSLVWLVVVVVELTALFAVARWLLFALPTALPRPHVRIGGISGVRGVITALFGQQ